MPRLPANLHGIAARLGALLMPRLSLAGANEFGCSSYYSIADGHGRIGTNGLADYALPAGERWMPEDLPIQVDHTQSQFRSEYEQELESWLRRRFRLVCISYL